MHAHDATSGDKHLQAKALVEQLWETRAGVVSTQVLQELAVNLRKKAKQAARRQNPPVRLCLSTWYGRWS